MMRLRSHRSRRPLAAWLLGIFALCAVTAARAADAPPDASGEARRIFEQAREKLVQIRTLALPSRSQASTGSGFVISADGLVVTNYHVVSQAALEKAPYALEFVAVDGQSGALEIVALDVQHDLAILKREGSALPVIELAAAEREMRRGEKLFSLGKPLDLGFVINEGLYNGLVERDLYGHLLFSGALNSGMSGGPALDTEGRVAGINVARRLDGQLVSFLIPVRYLHQLIVAPRPPLQLLAQRQAEIGRQLLAHQETVMATLFAKPWPSQIQGGYQVPVLPETLARCWGTNNADGGSGIGSSNTQCNLGAGRFVTGNLMLGNLRIEYRHHETSKLDSWRFWSAMRGQFSGRVFGGRKDRQRTPPRCEEADIDTAIGAQRVVMCFSAFHRFEGLYQFTLLAVTLDASGSALTSQLTADGVTEANAQRLARRVLDGMRWNPAH